MILSDKTIRTLLAGGQLDISPLEDIQIQPASVDIRLGDSFRLMEADGQIQMDAPIAYREVKAERFVLQPGQFVLATTAFLIAENGHSGICAVLVRLFF